jgi:N-acetylmuramate 1-kinase
MSSLCGFVLAAGLGNRMRPATLLRPKALLPFCGVELLTLALDELRQLPEIGRLLVNSAYLGEQVSAACREYSRERGVEVLCSEEGPRPLNHGGGIRKGIRELAPEVDEILVRNVDVIHDFPLEELLRFHRDSHADATLLLIPNKGVRSVRLTEDGEILDFHSENGQGYTFSGIYLMKREILDFLPEEEETPSILDAFRRAAKTGRRILGMVAPKECFWTDVGTPAEYIHAHQAALDCVMNHNPTLRDALEEQSLRRDLLGRQGVQCTGALGLGKDLRIPAGTKLHDVVLWDGVSLPHPGLYASGILCETPREIPPASSPQRLPDPRIGMTATTEGVPRAQGSGRRYLPLLKDGQKTGLLWSAYDLARQENSAFVAIDQFLAALGIPVPGIRMHLPDVGEIVQEDLGRQELSALPHEKRLSLLQEQVIPQAARLHVAGTREAQKNPLSLQPAFTRESYQWERDYFRKYLLQVVLDADELWTNEVAEESRGVREALLAGPQTLLHRDFQGANILVKDDRCFWIDFQGMRMGSPAYDLASLLYDPYTEYSPEERELCWNQYLQAVQNEGGTPPEASLLHIAAIQRLMQALGAYGKLWKENGLEWYKQHIPTGLQRLQEAAAAAKLPHFQTMAKKALKRLNAQKGGRRKEEGGN